MQKDGEGSKWSLSALKKHYLENGIDYDAIFEKIEDIIIKTFITVEQHMTRSGINYYLISVFEISLLLFLKLKLITLSFKFL